MRARPVPPPIYPIADHEALGDEMPAAVAELAAAGATWIQVRAKRLDDRRLYALVEACCGAAGRARIWVNDRPDLAALLPVAGVHLGQDDLPAAAAREVVGAEVWIGASTHDERELRRAAADEAVDVVALGPIFATTSKPGARQVVGIELLARARAWTTKPLVAIGGLDAENLGRALAAGADSAAVIGALGRPPLSERFSALERAAAEAR